MNEHLVDPGDFPNDVGTDADLQICQLQHEKTLRAFRDFLIRKCEDADLYDAFLEEFGLTGD